MHCHTRSLKSAGRGYAQRSQDCSGPADGVAFLTLGRQSARQCSIRGLGAQCGQASVDIGTGPSCSQALIVGSRRTDWRPGSWQSCGQSSSDGWEWQKKGGEKEERKGGVSKGRWRGQGMGRERRGSRWPAPPAASSARASGRMGSSWSGWARSPPPSHRGWISLQDGATRSSDGSSPERQHPPRSWPANPRQRSSAEAGGDWRRGPRRVAVGKQVWYSLV